jgi:3-phenylpropionate/cinnamic acid dioxygenase small subunit
MNNEQKLQEVWDRQEIEQLMFRHARSLDRMDAELFKSCYWEEGVEEHQDPIYPDLFHWNDNAWKFAPEAMKGFANLKITQHRISNILIELDGDTAVAETYVFAYHVHTDEEGVDQEGILGGRHHFKLEKRNDEWRIMHRSTVFDWNQNRPSTAEWSPKFDDKYRAGRGDKSDDSYNYLKRDGMPLRE